MGRLIDGQWVRDDKIARNASGGAFVRKATQFRNWVTPDGRAGVSGRAGFKAEPGRYHLYVSLACPWAHRTLILRALKGLQALISVSVVNAFMGDEGWTFAPGDAVLPDEVNQVRCIHELYTKAMPDYSGRATVPILWDKHRHTIVSNESAQIIRMFNSAFDQVGALPGDYYPQSLRAEIDALNQVIYTQLNNGVYRAGFARTQRAYDEALSDVFGLLDELEQRLSGQRYLLGDTLTEADWRLFPTLLRFDPVYVGHFKCNKKRIVDYPHLHRYLCDLFAHPGVRQTVDLDVIKNHYYQSHESINPTRIVPLGPQLSFKVPSERARFVDQTWV